MGKRKIDPRSALAMGMTNAKFQRRMRLACYILGCAADDLHRRYGLRDEFRKNIMKGLWPRPMDRREFMELFGLTNEIFYGPDEAPFVAAMREVRRWELSTGILTQTPSSWADFFARVRTRAFQPVAGVSPALSLTTRVPKKSASTSTSLSSPSATSSRTSSSPSPDGKRS